MLASCRLTTVSEKTTPTVVIIAPATSPTVPSRRSGTARRRFCGRGSAVSQISRWNATWRNPRVYVRAMTGPHHHPRHARDHGGAFRILTVCTGNVCRSPLAAQLLRERLPAAFAGHDVALIEIASAGTIALEGDRMDPLAVAEAERLGVADPAEHRARHLMPHHVERADLVIGMAREHRSAAVRMLPRAHHRAFTLIELTRTLEAVADGRAPVPIGSLAELGVAEFLRAAVKAAEVRGLQPMHQRHGLDIEDPYRRRPAVHRRSADAVADHVDRLVAALGSLAEGRLLAVAGEVQVQLA